MGGDVCRLRVTGGWCDQGEVIQGSRAAAEVPNVSNPARFPDHVLFP